MLTYDEIDEVYEKIERKKKIAFRGVLILHLATWAFIPILIFVFITTPKSSFGPNAGGVMALGMIFYYMMLIMSEICVAWTIVNWFHLSVSGRLLGLSLGCLLPLLLLT